MGIQALRIEFHRKKEGSGERTLFEESDLNIVSGFLSFFLSFFFKANQAGICTQLFELRMFLEQRLQWSRSWSLPVIYVLRKLRSFLSFMSFLYNFLYELLV